MKSRMVCCATLGMAALCQAVAGADALPLTNFADIPVLTNGPGKGCYAIFQGKLFEVQVTTNLDLLVYPVDNGKRMEPPITLHTCFTTPGLGLNYIGLLKPDPPCLNPQKLVLRVVTDTGAQLVQTWKFSDGLLSVNNLFKDFTGAVPSTRVTIMFPKTHTFTTASTPAERDAATAGCMLRCRAGHSDTSMKIITVPYANRIMAQEICDWMEHRGPWGARKVTIKRTTNKSIFNIPGSVYVYEGVWTTFLTRFDAMKRGELQGFELKVE